MNIRLIICLLAGSVCVCMCAYGEAQSTGDSRFMAHGTDVMIYAESPKHTTRNGLCVCVWAWIAHTHTHCGHFERCFVSGLTTSCLWVFIFFVFFFFFGFICCCHCCFLFSLPLHHFIRRTARPLCPLIVNRCEQNRGWERARERKRKTRFNLNKTIIVYMHNCLLKFKRVRLKCRTHILIVELQNLFSSKTKIQFWRKPKTMTEKKQQRHQQQTKQ